MKQTTESEELPEWSVELLAAEVVDGPSEGLSVTAKSETLSVGTAQGNDLVVKDETASRFHLELERCAEGVLVRDAGSTNGTFAGTIRIKEAIVAPGTVLRAGNTSIRVEDAGRSRLSVHPGSTLGLLRGESAQMRRLMARVERAAKSEAPVLITGESGTGKEIAARSLHELGPRTGAPFVTVDCGALAPNLIASELFGHERGAFTGADRQHVGAFEQANGGTLFLDEVGELPAELQPTLLGALERKRFRRVGGRQEISTNVRIIAATNRDLRAEVNAGVFRLDLYYRIAVVVLKMPALRDRPEDIPVLIRHFLDEFGSSDALAIFSSETIGQLSHHAWPGNARELRNLVEATLAMGEPPEPELSANMEQNSSHAFEPFFPLPYREARAGILSSFERAYASHWLSESEGNVASAARQARMDRSTLFELIRKHKLR